MEEIKIFIGVLIILVLIPFSVKGIHNINECWKKRNDLYLKKRKP